MKNQKPKYLLIGIIAFVCIILFGLGGNYLKKQSQPLPSPITPMADKINNWKTYTNSNLGLTFKYPQNWIDPSVRPQSTHTEIGFDPSNANLSIIIGFDYNQTTGKNITYSETISSATANLKSQEDFLLDGIKGKKIIYTMGASTLDILYIVPVPNESGDILKIQYTIPHGDPDTSKLFDQILSTFKFLDNSNNVTSNTNNYDTAIKMLQAIPEIQIIENAVIKNGRKTFFMQSDVNGDVVKIWLYEGGFPDQHTTKIDIFNVNVKSGVITVDDVAMKSGQETITLDEWKKTIKIRFQ